MRPVVKHYSIRCAMRGEPRPGIGRPIAFPRYPDTRRLVAEGSLTSSSSPRLPPPTSIPASTRLAQCLIDALVPYNQEALHDWLVLANTFFLHVQFRVSLSPCIMSFAMVVTLEMIVRTTRPHSGAQGLASGHNSVARWPPPRFDNADLANIEHHHHNARYDHVQPQLA